MNEFETGNKKNALIILSGCPGSGKSTWGKKFAEENNVIYVSTDSIRAEIGTGEGDQNVSAAAFTLAKQRVSEALKSGKSAMIDATSVNKKSRRDWINMGRGNGAFVIAVAFEVPREELIKRDSKRNRTVGPSVIDHFLNKYERPSNSEGIDKIIVK